MIRIRKPAQTPAVLSSKGTRKCTEHCDAYDNGEREFSFAERPAEEFRPDDRADRDLGA